MSLTLRRVGRALTRGEAATAPDADDPRLRGRTYAVPFERVWQSALALAGGELPRWTLVEADDHAGYIRAEATTLVRRDVDDVRIHIALDEDAQTRVDLAVTAREPRFDLGRSARRIHRFLRALDDHVRG